MSLAAVWERALPFLGVRSNDEHTRYAFRFAKALTARSGARADIVLPAIILHDVGWSTVPPDKLLQSFGPNLKYPELRRQHEVEGARIARQILEDLGYPERDIASIGAIIDGHDTRAEPLSIDDAAVKDADKLWLFTPFGMETVRDWFGYSPEGYLTFLGGVTTRLHTEPGRLMAAGLLVGLEATWAPAPPS